MTYDTAIADALERWRTSPMAYGESDCGLAIAEIYRDVMGVDIAAHLRTYDSVEGCHDLIDGVKGGLVSIARGICRRQGWRRCDLSDVVTGDPGLVESLSGLSFAICRGDSWIVRADFGFSVLPLDAAVICWKAVR